MIKKRLIAELGDSKKYIAGNVAAQWVGMLSNAVMIFSLGSLLQKLVENKSAGVGAAVAATVISLIVRAVCSFLQEKFSYLASKSVKKRLREMIFSKLLRLGSGYREKVSTSEVVQVSVEGIDQLETYFGQYLPQFFYAMIAPVTLFVMLSFVSFKSALVLLICVPLIPMAIVAVQKIAKKLLNKYWGQYTKLGDTFLENLQGLTTLKIYQADEYKNQQMNEESEKFRKITMKVLTMQLNSVTIMDLIAYGGAALGVILAAGQFRQGVIGLSGCFVIIMLSADFFIPMRRLGSFFHVAMNGMAASDKMFAILDLPEPEKKSGVVDRDNCTIKCTDMSFSYTTDREVIHGADIEFKAGCLTAVCGESGCGKSTIAAILMGRNNGYKGSVRIGNTELCDISEESLMKNITYISHSSVLFKGTVRENLLMAKSDAEDSELWQVLEKTKLADFLRGEKGLNTLLVENAANLSGGQKQRLALARALLHDSAVYIFDEATSNIDADSENDIMEQIFELAKNKTVIVISHRLANTAKADMIYAMEKGEVRECGTHDKLVQKNGLYAKLWNAQQSLEAVRNGGVCQ
ncbi:ABC transporter ATP-binding protein/permease [Ruminococcus sp. AF37-20]|uniref:ABC transporter ATP-binding protein/permease n=1 Tax=Ruminococcus sp. AF37-20 TaxID=2293178 RepID=UPI000E4FFD49|nr:ABC transporter ATP-binding protein/permease [Ruminococcus sp. AF37-20]RGF46376.1 ABC transporter ATP-binding protein/permease [Ruminococcus sp. AF37-20]